MLQLIAFNSYGQSEQPFKAGVFVTAYNDALQTAIVEVRLRTDRDFAGSIVSNIQFTLRSPGRNDVEIGSVISSPAEISRGTGTNDCGVQTGEGYCMYVGIPTWVVDFPAGSEIMVAVLEVTGRATDSIELMTSSVSGELGGEVDGRYYVEYGGAGYYLENNADPEAEFYRAGTVLGNVVGTGRQTEVLGPSLLAPKLSISPNPSSGRVRIVMSDTGRTAMPIRIVDAQGREWYAASVESMGGRSSEVLLDATSWPSGHYFCTVTLDARTLESSFLVVR